MTWEEQQAEWRRQYAELGLPVPAQPLVGPHQGMSAKQAAYGLGAQIATSAIPMPFLRQIGAAGRSIANFFAPRRVGVHHTVAGTHLGGPTPKTLPYWTSRYVKPSSADYGKAGVTSSDQIPNMSYFWDATGNNARRAAIEGVNQPNKIIANNIFDRDTTSRALTVTAPRFGVLEDVNPGVQGGVARMVPGPNQLRVTGEVAGTRGVDVRIPGTRVDVPGGLPQSAADDLVSMINRQKALEATKSAAKIGTAAAATQAPMGVQALRQVLSGNTLPAKKPTQSRGGGGDAFFL